MKKRASGKLRKYCSKCGLTWFAKDAKERCPDCNPSDIKMGAGDYEDMLPENQLPKQKGKTLRQAQIIQKLETNATAIQQAEVEEAVAKTKRNDTSEILQALYDAACRKLNAARDNHSPEAIAEAGKKIAAITKRAGAAGIVINIQSDDSFGKDEPRIHKGMFSCNGISFEIDVKDLNKALGTNGESSPLDHLMDSQVAELGRALGLRVDPFVRELIVLPIRGMIQAVWYRDLGHKADFAHLKDNQVARIEKYHRDLAFWRPDEAAGHDPNGQHRRARKSGSAVKSTMMSKSFVAVADKSVKVPTGRASDLLAVVVSLKKVSSFSQIVTAAQGKLKTKQDFEKIVARFLRELIEAGAVKEA